MNGFGWSSAKLKDLNGVSSAINFLGCEFVWFPGHLRPQLPWLRLDETVSGQHVAGKVVRWRQESRQNEELE